MITTKHTPTPWMVAADGYIAQKVKPDAEGNPEGQTIALMHNFSQKYANAAFIVKAVNVYEILLEGLKDIAATGEGWEKERAKAALAKAMEG